MKTVKNYENWLVEITSAEARKATEIFLSAGGKQRYNEIFQGQDRIYYDFKSDEKVTSPILDEVSNFLSSEGYHLLDYLQGTCYKDNDPKRILKVGKVLFSLGKEKLAQSMNNDPIRAGSKTTEMKVVISRHGIDIAGQSTDRNWTSCKDLRSGMNAKYIWSEIKAGALVAYLIKSNDLNIKNPIARISIGVYRGGGKENKKSILLYPQSQVYGNYNKEHFQNFIENWCIEANRKINTLPGEYFIDPQCHIETFPRVNVRKTNSLKDYFKRFASSNDTATIDLDDVTDFSDFFDEISKNKKETVELFIKKMPFSSSVIADILENNDIKDIKTTHREHPYLISAMLNYSEKDWKKISKKRAIEILELYEELLGEDLLLVLKDATTAASRFLKIAYNDKYKK